MGCFMMFLLKASKLTVRAAGQFCVEQNWGYGECWNALKSCVSVTNKLLHVAISLLLGLDHLDSNIPTGSLRRRSFRLCSVKMKMEIMRRNLEMQDLKL